MNSTSGTIKILWDGPYGWPKFEGILPPVPSQHRGVYLQTVEYRNGYLIYAAGITRRSIRTRFAEHTRSYMDGDYNVLDIAAMKRGVRRRIWHGWGWSPEKRVRFEKRRPIIVKAVRKQLEGFRIFVANLDADKRILERIEASIMNALYKHRQFRIVPDKGMHLVPCRTVEQPMSARNICSSTLYGLPTFFEI